MARQKTWALVTNGVRARILRVLEGGGESPIDLASNSTSLHLRDHLSDRAGRSFGSDASGGRRAMEPGSDPALRDMQDVARDVCRVLEGHLRAGDLTRRAVVAAPKMPGVLRAELPDPLAAIVRLERDATLVNLSEAELQDAVADEIRKERGR